MKNSISRVWVSLAIAWSLIFAGLPAPAAAQCVVPANGFVVKTTSYTALANDTGKSFVMNCAAPCTLTLPSTAQSPVWEINVTSIGVGQATVSPNGRLLDGLSGSFLIPQGVGVSTSIGTDNSDYFTRQGATLPYYFCQDAGATDAYACTASPALNAYNTGYMYVMKANTANTGAATANFSSLGAKTIKKTIGGITTDLSDNDVRAGSWMVLIYDGTNLQLVSSLGNGIGPSTTDTFTNKNIDAEGTGNVITAPFKVWLPAAGCGGAAGTTAASFWDQPTTTPALAACVTGTNIQKGVLQYADTAGGFSAQTTLILPADFSGAIDARIIWRTSATTGNAKFSLSTICTDVAATATDDPAFNSPSVVTTAAPGTTLRIQSSAIAGVTATGCVAGNLLHLKLFRDGNDGSDTIGASLDVLGVELTIRRAM